MEFSLKLFLHIHGYLFIFANTEIYVIYNIKFIEKLSRRHLIDSSDVFIIKGFTVGNVILSNKSGLKSRIKGI